jgi:hypothetical protein
VPDTAKYSDISQINNVLLTKPFNLTKDSKALYTETSGFTDSLSAANSLGDNGYISCKVQLIDDAANKVTGTLNDISFNAGRIHQAKLISCLIDTKNIKAGTYRIKITMNTNKNGAKVRLFENRALENLADLSLAKTVSCKDLQKATEFNLGQNYPNPFNPSTIIKYSLPSNCQVTLEVYNLLGEKIVTLVNGQKDAGNHEVTFNGSKLTSGVYIYKITAVSTQTGEHFVKSAKMMMIK